MPITTELELELETTLDSPNPLAKIDPNILFFLLVHKLEQRNGLYQCELMTHLHKYEKRINPLKPFCI